MMKSVFNFLLVTSGTTCLSSISTVNARSTRADMLTTDDCTVGEFLSTSKNECVTCDNSTWPIYLCKNNEYPKFDTNQTCSGNSTNINDTPYTCLECPPSPAQNCIAPASCKRYRGQAPPVEESCLVCDEGYYSYLSSNTTLFGECKKCLNTETTCEAKGKFWTLTDSCMSNYKSNVDTSECGCMKIDGCDSYDPVTCECTKCTAGKTMESGTATGNDGNTHTTNVCRDNICTCDNGAAWENSKHGSFDNICLHDGQENCFFCFQGYYRELVSADSSIFTCKPIKTEENANNNGNNSSANSLNTNYSHFATTVVATFFTSLALF